MKTDDLIDILSASVEGVDRRLMSRTIAGAVAVGAVVALGVALIMLGSRSDAWRAEAFGFVFSKLAFALTVAALAFIYLIRFARPTGGRRGSTAFLALPFVCIVGLAAISLAYAPAAHWQTMFLDDEWLECLLSIPIIAIVPFALVVWAVRQAAPTDLRRAGALAGLVAGGLSAAGYALHCTADSLPFVAVWYSGTILLCTLAGAVLGPRLLRW